jgi:hypothetical protein
MTSNARQWLAEELQDRVEGMLADPDSGVTDRAVAEEWALRDLSDLVEDYPEDFTKAQRNVVMEALVTGGFYAEVSDEMVRQTVVLGRKARLFPRWNGKRYEFVNWMLTKGA